MPRKGVIRSRHRPHGRVQASGPARTRRLETKNKSSHQSRQSTREGACLQPAEIASWVGSPQRRTQPITDTPLTHLRQVGRIGNLVESYGPRETFPCDTTVQNSVCLDDVRAIAHTRLENKARRGKAARKLRHCVRRVRCFICW